MFIHAEKPTNVDLDHERSYKNRTNMNKNITDYKCYLAVTMQLQYSIILIVLEVRKKIYIILILKLGKRKTIK